jgi:hypothetical protein
MLGISTSAMSYSLSVQPRDKLPPADRSSVEAVVAGVPGVRGYPSAGLFEYGHAPGCVLHIWLEGDSQIDAARVSLPAAYNRKDNVALCRLAAFWIADHLGWQVYDPQADEYFDRTVAQDALQAQKRWGATSDEVLARRAGGNAPFHAAFLYYFCRPAPWVIVFALLLVAGAPGYLIYLLSLPLRAFFWLAAATGLFIFGGSAFLRSVAHAKRTG